MNNTCHCCGESENLVPVTINNETIFLCNECKEAHLKQCSQCDEFFIDTENDYAVSRDGDIYCESCRDEYLTYCGAIYVLDDFLDLCAEIDLERTREAIKDLDPVYKKDMRAYARFFDPYRHSAASDIADTTNNAYLNAMGQEEGTLSYSRILRLVSAYFLKHSSR